MNACVLRETKQVSERPLQYVDVERPAAGPRQILIRVRACGVCRTDLHVVEGELDQTKQRRPLIPGHQIVGEVVETGDGARGNTAAEDELKAGDRVGVAWLHRTCGKCRFCRRGDENLCEAAEFTGYTRDGGYAEYVLAERDFVYRLPGKMSDLEIAPLLCAGIIGYRCLRLTGIARDDWSGARLGIYGFGAAGHIAIQIARARGADVYVCTRDERHRRLARELGAAWVGGATDASPERLNASIIFAPAGEIVPPALAALDRGGVLVCGGIHMTPIPQIPYERLYWERVIRSVANNTREDGEAFLKEAAEVGVRTAIETFPLQQANDALDRLKNDAIRGAAVLVVQ